LFAVDLEVTAGAEEKFPTRPVEIIIPTGPGGGADTMVRILSDAIEPFLEQKVVVINKLDPDVASLLSPGVRVI
jgi:tripartite-type tricarboxylate transporter receptor subunit TctC